MSLLHTCSICSKKAEERYFHSIRYGFVMCLECWQLRIKDTEKLAKRLGADNDI